jgi:hypothetical protein
MATTVNDVLNELNQNYKNEIDTEEGLKMLNTVIENLEDDKKINYI